MASYIKLADTARETRFTLRARDVQLTSAAENAIRRILTNSLGRLARRIKAIHVWLEDVNGPRGGVDVRCRIEVALNPRGRVSVSALAADKHAAVAAAALRAREHLDRRVKKLRARRRQLVHA